MHPSFHLLFVLLNVLVLCLGAAVGTYILGLSIVFGAFLVGMVLRETRFVHQALAQQASRDVTVEDGWRYFLHGWTAAIAEVLHLEIDEATFDRLAHVAAQAR